MNVSHIVTYDVERVDGFPLDYLVIAGGGGGGSGQAPGGGGAGGYLNGTLNIPANGTVYNVTVGDGGATENDGYNGGDSSFGDVVSKGGGGGAFYYNDGKDGGSGGGGGMWDYPKNRGRAIIMNRTLRSLECRLLLCDL